MQVRIHKHTESYRHTESENLIGKCEDRKKTHSVLILPAPIQTLPQLHNQTTCNHPAILYPCASVFGPEVKSSIPPATSPSHQSQ